MQALKDVSITLNGGKLTVLMGPSGSGKTTLLSILGCMWRLPRGLYRVCGASTSGARPEELAKIRRQHIGFVFQSYHLFATLTVAENVRLALDVRGEHRLEAMVKSEEVRTARMGRNPATGEAITIKASKKVAFRAARI